MQPTFSVTKVYENLAGIRAGLAALTKQDVYVGVPADEAAREKDGDTGISNAALAYIHEHGAPEVGLEARAALIPGIKDALPDVITEMRNCAKAAIEGDVHAVEQGLVNAGDYALNAVQKKFEPGNNDWKPLDESYAKYKPLIKDDEGNVIFYKGGKNKGEARRGPSRADRGGGPLRDTEQMMKSYKAVVRKKGNTALVVK